MPVAIETVIIIIVVVSFAVLSAVIFALYWLWRLLLEDRRCNRLGSTTFQNQWQCQAAINALEDGPQRALLGSRRDRIPRISRRQEVFVDERSRRMVKAARFTEGPLATSETLVPVRSQPPPTPARPTSHPPAHQRTELPEVVVLDGTEPPPPYEAVIR